MAFSYQKRKKTHLALFVILIIIQLLLFYFWKINHNNQNEITSAFQNLNKPNKALFFSNEANKYYFEAQSNFEDYLNNNNANSFLAYQKGLQKMTVYLDSLNLLTNTKADFKEIISSKKKTEGDVVALRKQLDSLIIVGHKTAKTISKSSVKFKNTDNSKVLKSVRMDTVRSFEKIKKKGVLGRIKDALSNKKETEREVVKIFYVVTYEKASPARSLESPFKYQIDDSNQNSNYELQKIKNTYVNLSLKGEDLLTINKRILNRSQDLIKLYSQSAQEIEDAKYKNIINHYFEANKRQNDLVFYLLFSASLFILTLLYYTYNAIKNEEKLHSTKREIEKNLDFKNKIIGMLSHEMRAPLSIISTVTNEIKTHNKNPDITEHANTLNFTSKSLQITVNQILDFFKKESSELVLYHSVFNLKTEITAVVDSLKSLGENKKVDIISKINPNLDTLVWADSTKIHQLFYNIIGNALKFTEKGNITVLANASEENSKLKLEISIKDTGIGIPSEDLKHIFDKYYQSNHSDSKASLGIGLGLNLCKEIVELHNGKIEVKSQKNEGTEVSFYLLLDQPNEDTNSAKKQILETFKDKNITVALVDDDLFILSIIKKLMDKIHFTLVDFSTVKDIKTYLNQNKVDLIITDLNISTDSGLEFAQEIKTTDNHNQNIPIIAITGNNYVENIESRPEYLDELIIKPIHKEELYSKILKVLIKDKNH
ncbi:MAG: hybrid sensor histidine kinase/response regulator [Bacteroidota bacterium]